MCVLPGCSILSVPSQANVDEGENPYDGQDKDYEVSSIFSHNFAFSEYTGVVEDAKIQRALRQMLVNPNFALVTGAVTCN